MFFGRSLVQHLRQLWVAEEPQAVQAPKAVDTELPSESEEEICDWDWVQDLQDLPDSEDASTVEGSETETGAVRALDEVPPVLLTTETPESPIEEASPSEEMSPPLSPPVSPPAPPERKRTKRLIIPCGMPPGLVPSGSEDELAAKLRKRLAKVEQEGLVLLKSQVPSLADAHAFSAEEAKAARLPKWGQSTAQLLYASKRHSWFDFEELEEEERRPRP